MSKIDAEVKNAVRATDKSAQYDEKVKRLLGHKYVLAHILIKTVDEFKGMNPKDIVKCIEGEPFISVVPVEPGLTNVQEKQGKRVVGLNTENAEINEGLIRFDIIFYVRMKDGLSQIIVNIEAQRDAPIGYDILNRAIFYVSRLISSQKERDFVNTNYNDIKRVFSIWICMNRKENSMDYVHLTKDNLLGSCEWTGRLDLLNIVLIGLSNELPEHDEKYDLHRLLGALLSKQLSIDEKLNIIKTEYNIPVENNIREDVSTMCNLGQGILEEGIAIGEAKGKAIGEAIGEARGEARGKAIGEAKGKAIGEAKIIIKMYKNGLEMEQIASITDKDVEEIKVIVENQETVLV